MKCGAGELFREAMVDQTDGENNHLFSPGAILCKTKTHDLFRADKEVLVGIYLDENATQTKQVQRLVCRYDSKDSSRGSSRTRSKNLIREDFLPRGTLHMNPATVGLLSVFAVMRSA
jgi:hypothetical protein